MNKLVFPLLAAAAIAAPLAAQVAAPEMPSFAHGVKVGHARWVAAPHTGAEPIANGPRAREVGGRGAPPAPRGARRG